MIERDDVDKAALAREFGIEIGGVFEMDREHFKNLDDTIYTDEDNGGWGQNWCGFFRELAQHESIKGVAFSTRPSREMQVDYFCLGSNGRQIEDVVWHLTMARELIDEPQGSIQWLSANQTFEDAVRIFKAGLNAPNDKRDLLLIGKFV